MSVYQVPSNFQVPLIFNVSLDGQPHTLTVFYQFYGQRLYFQVVDSVGNIIVTKPLISSEGTFNNLKNYFDTALFYSSTDEIILVQ